MIQIWQNDVNPTESPSLTANFTDVYDVPVHTDRCFANIFIFLYATHRDDACVNISLFVFCLYLGVYDPLTYSKKNYSLMRTDCDWPTK